MSASPGRVWTVLCDGQHCCDWDCGVDAVEGRIKLGATITSGSQASPGRTFPVQVTAFEPPNRLRITEGMPLRLFRGVHTYDVYPGQNGGSAFRICEEYTGPLLRLMLRSMPDLGPSFVQFAEGLRHHFEWGA